MKRTFQRRPSRVGPGVVLGARGDEFSDRRVEMFVVDRDPEGLT